MVAIAAAFAAAALAAFLVGSFSVRIPRIRSWRPDASMPVGGAALAAITIGVTGIGVALTEGGGNNTYAADGPHSVHCLLLIASLFVVACALRLVKAPEWTLLLMVCMAAFVAAGVGVRIDSIKLPFTIDFVSLGSSVIPLTLIWITCLTWVFASTSELPGLTPGVGCISALTLLVLSRIQPQRQSEFVPILTAAFAGSCAGGFLPSLGSPAFAAGRAGSIVLGFTLSIITVLAALKNTAFLILLLPLMIVGAPLIDFSFAVLSRSGKAESLAFTQARGPLHRALLRLGWQPRRITFLYLAIEAYICALAILLVLLIRVHFVIKLIVLLPFAAAGWLFFISIIKLIARPENYRHASADHKIDRIDLLNVSVSAVTMDQAVSQIQEFIRTRQPHMVVTSDASAVVRSQHDEELHRIINEADLVTPDGIGVIWSARFLDLPLYERVPGVDLALALFAQSAESGHSFFLLGAAPGVADEAVIRLQERFPGLRIVGTHHGFFTSEDEPDLIRRIHDSGADILLVGLGIPRQEKWIKKHLHELGIPVCIGVGGSLDVYAGRVRRAPVWIQRIGMEWLYRTLRDPRRLGRAMMLPRLVLLTLFKTIGYGSAGRGDVETQ